MKALFINADSSKPHCAVFQAGKIYGKAMKLCTSFDLDYVEVCEGGEAPALEGYDAVIFNYQHLTMQIVPPHYFSYCPIAIGFLYEARSVPADSPMHFGELKAGEVFDILISPDPTLASTPKVWGVPRVIPRTYDWYVKGYNPAVWPRIKTFGFPSPWKNLKGVIEMMNEEFESGEFCLNFSQASHQQGTPLHERQIQAARELREIAKPEIYLDITTNYMPDDKLIAWLQDSDLNVFLSYEERGIQTGGALLASADMAIAAQRPLLVSDNIEARHLLGCKWANLKEAMALSEQSVRILYDIWSPENFAQQLDKKVREYLS